MLQPALRLVLSIAAVLSASGALANLPFEGDPSLYFGHLFVYERAERFESVLGGSVTLLKPGGFDELRDAPEAVLVEGVISAETVEHVVRLLTRVKFREVFLDSPGGDLNAGLRLGILLKDLRATAIVNARAQCESACALAFLGAGNHRLVLTDPGRFGFHRQYRIVDGKIVYGSRSGDERLIADYLRAVGAAGISADEIVSTTGLASFSKDALLARKVITLTDEKLRELAKVIYESTGMSTYEVFRRMCSAYRQSGPHRSSPDGLDWDVLCLLKPPAMREPLLRLAVDLPQLNEAKRSYFLVTFGDALGFGFTTGEAIVRLNKTFDGDANARYPVYLEKRNEYRRHMKRLEN